MRVHAAAGGATDTQRVDTALGAPEARLCLTVCLIDGGERVAIQPMGAAVGLCNGVKRHVKRHCLGESCSIRT